MVLRIFGWICAVLVLLVLFIFIPLQAIDRDTRPCNLLFAYIFCPLCFNIFSGVCIFL